VGMSRDDDAFVDGDMEPDPELNKLTNDVIGAAIAVHRALGPGQLESAYQRAMEIELEYRQIPFQRQVPVRLVYRNQTVGQGFVDLLIDNRVIVELKAAEYIAPVHRVQIISYLKMTKLKLGIIINFNVPVLKDGIRRIAN
jgi:GxxExxY protein